MPPMAKGYIHTFNPEEQKRLIHQAEHLVPWIHQSIDLSGCKHVLEVGCGVGAQLRVLARRFPQTRFTGIDFAPEQIAHARVLLREELASGQVTLLEGSAYELPFENGGFDGAFLCWVLEHLADPPLAMRELARGPAGWGSPLRHRSLQSRRLRSPSHGGHDRVLERVQRPPA